MQDINASISRLLDYAVKNKMIAESDRLWAANAIIAKLKLSSFTQVKIKEKLPKYPRQILSDISTFAAENKIIQDLPFSKDIFENSIMGIFLQRPSDFVKTFQEIAAKKNIKAATDYLYEKECQSCYIKVQEIEKNIVWKSKTKYGSIDIAINLSKPEKTPQEIALIKELGAKGLAENSYPKCLLCRENEGFEGGASIAPKNNLRLIPLKLDGETWYFQFSPYVYYKEHCIVFDSRHKDMEINSKTFAKLLDFLDNFPHYFIGSNADLPIVGGSILNHDHYQGGNYIFPMHRAAVKKTFKLKKFPRLKCGILNWHLSVIRLNGNRKDILGASSLIFERWKKYSDAKAEIEAFSGDIRHNTLNPFAKKIGDAFQMDLALRNNRTSPQFPEGIFHTDPKYYHLKRENMGLIEVLGRGILPPRLKDELQRVKESLIAGEVESLKSDVAAAKHYFWAKELSEKYSFNAENAEKIMRDEIAARFCQALDCCAVFKKNRDGEEAFDRFINSLNGCKS